MSKARKRNAADIVFDMEDGLGRAQRLVRAIVLAGRSDGGKDGDSVAEVALAALAELEKVEEARREALALSGPTSVAGAEYAGAHAGAAGSA